MIRFLIAGMLIGSAHLAPPFWILTWFGIVWLAMLSEQAHGSTARALGLLLAGFGRMAVALCWLVSTCHTYVGLPLHWALLAAGTLCAVCAVLAHGPLSLACSTTRMPLRWTLPLAWLAGEWLLDLATGGFNCGAVLYGQHQADPLLRLLAYLGWYPTVLLMLYVNCCLSEAIQSKRIPPLLAAIMLLGFMVGLPAIPTTHFRVLEGVSTTALSAWRAPMPEFSPSTQLVVWPEGIASRHPNMTALRDGYPLRDSLPPDAPHTAHLLGMISHRGRDSYNLAVMINEDSLFKELRTKALLVPLGERPLLGIEPVGGRFKEGSNFTLMRFGNTKVLPLICFEAFSREPLSAIDEEGDRTWIAVLASDRPFAGNDLAIGQSIGALVLRAVEGHVSGLRASLQGTAAFVAEDGRVFSLKSKTSAVAITAERGRILYLTGHTPASAGVVSAY